MALLRKEDLSRGSLPVANEPRIPSQDALLGKGSRFEGKLTFEGTVRIDGEFIGEITSQGNLILGPTAKVQATSTVQSANISGQFQGNLTSSALELKSSAQVVAKLFVQSLVVEQGAFFDGEVHMAQPQAAEILDENDYTGASAAIRSI